MSRPASVRSQASDLGPEDIQQEAALGRAYDARLMRRLWSYIRPYRRAFWWSLLLLPLISACSLVQPYLLKLAIDHYIAGGDVTGLLRIGCLYGAAMVAEFALFYAQYLLTMHVAQRSLADLRAALFAHVQKLSAAFFDRNPVGRLVTRLTSDVDVINEMFAAGAFTIAMDVLTLLGIVVIMLTIDWRLALATLSVLPVLLLAINFAFLTVKISPRCISTGYGVFHHNIPTEDITGYYRVEAADLVYGGFGIRFGWNNGKRRIVYNVMNKPGVVIQRRSLPNREFVFSSNDTERVMETLRAIQPK